MLLITKQLNGPLEQFDVYWTFKIFRLLNNIETGFMINILVIIFLITFIFFDINNVIIEGYTKVKFFKTPSLAQETFTNLTDKIISQLGNYFATNGPYPFKILLFGVFFEILFLNYLGIFPNNDALTSTFILPFFLAFLFVGIAFLMKYIRYGIQAWSFFVPSAPLLLLGLIVIVELISYSIKLVSLSGRLFANIFSGHVLLAILSGATFVLFEDITTFLFGIFGPTIIVFSVFCLEFFIAFLQAYVFANLGAMYLGDTIVKNEH